jgi:hypothetical protein
VVLAEVPGDKLLLAGQLHLPAAKDFELLLPGTDRDRAGPSHQPGEAEADS